MQKLAAKFIEVMKECSHIAKNGENGFHGYKYVTSANVLEKVNAALVKQGIASVAIPELLNMLDVTTAKGNLEHLATVKMDITLVDKESGEVLNITGLGSGQDSGDKAVMKAQTAAIKYAYMLSLAISTGDDPEADRSTDENMQVAPQQPVIKNSKARTTSRAKVIAASKEQPFLTCSACGVVITEKVARYSEGKYGQVLCMGCQKKIKEIA
jgi:formylmethanofuran dehydrogenase subunit E